MTSCLKWVQEMMTSADKVGGWVKKGQNHDDGILEQYITAVVTSPDFSSCKYALVGKFRISWFINTVTLAQILRNAFFTGTKLRVS